SEQGEEKLFPNIQGVNHIFKYHKPKSELSDFNPGNIRNIGIKNSTGEFIYTNDADIILPDITYLSRAKEFLEANQGKTIFRPKMRRLPIDNFTVFNNWIEQYGIVEAISKLNFEQTYIVTVDGLPRKVRVFEKDSSYKKTFTAFEEDFQKFITGENKGKEPIFWNENRHCGGNMFRREQFVSVGGYCEDFVNWGCEDSDLQWKFAEKYGIEFFPDELEVIHLDHPKGYFSPEMWVRNEKIITQRKSEGVESAIRLDKSVYLRGEK
ncbi:MAG: glycosyltransferase family 2 protein, partial [Nanoarchaeota archaeon]